MSEGHMPDKNPLLPISSNVIYTPDTSGLNLPNTDILLNKRIWDGNNNGIAIIDMGAYEFGSIPVNIKEPIIIETSKQVELKIFPNPFTQLTTIELEFNGKNRIALLIYNQLGKKVETIFEGKLEKGNHQLSWNSENLSSGIYFIKLETEKGITTQKMIRR